MFSTKNQQIFFHTHECAGIRIGFAETDFLFDEGDGEAKLLLTKIESTTVDVTVRVTVVTFDEFDALGREFPSTFSKLTLPDAAECKCLVLCVAK